MKRHGTADGFRARNPSSLMDLKLAGQKQRHVLMIVTKLTKKLSQTLRSAGARRHTAVDGFQAREETDPNSQKGSALELRKNLKLANESIQMQRSEKPSSGGRISNSQRSRSAFTKRRATSLQMDLKFAGAKNSMVVVSHRFTLRCDINNTCANGSFTSRHQHRKSHKNCIS